MRKHTFFAEQTSLNGGDAYMLIGRDQDTNLPGGPLVGCLGVETRVRQIVCTSSKRTTRAVLIFSVNGKSLGWGDAKGTTFEINDFPIEIAARDSIRMEVTGLLPGEKIRVELRGEASV